MQLWTDVRRRVLAEGLSKRQACREYGLHWRTLTKILEHSEPPGYRQARPRPKRKLEPLLPIIHEILKQDRHVWRKQRHTAKRIFDRLRAEHGYDGGYTIVKDAVRAWRNQHAQVILNGAEVKVALFVMTLVASGAASLTEALKVLEKRRTERARAAAWRREYNASKKTSR